MRILLVGGTGFVGGALSRRLLEAGHAVAAFHRGDSSGGAETIRGDRRNLTSFRERFRAFRPDVVVDTIAYTEGDGRQLVVAFQGIAPRLVVLSSGDVYAPYGRLLGLESGEPFRAPLAEDAPLRASRFPYRATAKPGEMAYDYEKILVESAVTAAEAAVTILRLPKVYGPGDARRDVRACLERMSKSGGEILLDRAKAAWRWTRGYVEDVADAIALAATDPRARGCVYNLGEERALSEAEWIAAIGAAAGWPGSVRWVEREELEPELAEPYDFTHDLAADTGRIRRELDYRERIGPGEGVRQTVEWELSHA